MDRYLALMTTLVLILAAGCRSAEKGNAEHEAHGEHAEHEGHAGHEAHADHEGHADHEEEAVRLTAAQRTAAEIEAFTVLTTLHCAATATSVGMWMVMVISVYLPTGMVLNVDEQCMSFPVVGTHVQLLDDTKLVPSGSSSSTSTVPI